MKFSKQEMFHFLEEKHFLYNNLSFIENDPISIPHLFERKEDIEIAAFLTATISWGQRISIIKSASELMLLMDNRPYSFIASASENELKTLDKFVYRTFNNTDTLFFIKSLRNIYKNYGGIEQLFIEGFIKIDENLINGIVNFRKAFFELSHKQRVEKHFSNPLNNSSSKRLNMFLRWMIRKDKNKVDFGIWSSFKSSQLLCPLDIHSGRVARDLGLLKRKQNDWKAVIELTDKLKEFDPNDPVKYDFALFGLGVFEKFGKYK
jgi:uncharacterized protein (TIGR02757 family)